MFSLCTVCIALSECSISAFLHCWQAWEFNVCWGGQIIYFPCRSWRFIRSEKPHWTKFWGSWVHSHNNIIVNIFLSCIVHNWLTDYMEQHRFWEAYCCSAWLEISHIWKPVVYHHAGRALLLGPTLHQMNPVHYNQFLDLTRGLFHSVFSPLQYFMYSSFIIYIFKQKCRK